MNRQVFSKVEKPEGYAGGDSPDFLFWCPGCKCGHAVWTTKANRLNATWSWNGDMEKPTLTPSLLIRYTRWVPPVTPENMDEWDKNPWPQTQKQHVCHTFIRNGQIQFLGDCTHELANKTVPMWYLDENGAWKE